MRDGDTYFDNVFTWADYLKLKTASGLGQVAAMTSERSMVLTGPEGAVEARVRIASINYFEVLGAGRSSGRLFQPGDAEAAVVPVVVSSDFNEGAPGDLLGSRLELAGVPVLVVGVTPPGFLGASPRAFDLVLPLEAAVRFTSPAEEGAAPTWAFPFHLVVLVEDARVRALRLSDLAPLIDFGDRRAVGVGAMTWSGGIGSRSVLHLEGGSAFLVLGLVLFLVAVLNGWVVEMAAHARNGVDHAVQRALGAAPGQLLARDAFRAVVTGAAAGGIAYLPARIGAEWIRSATLGRFLGPHALESGAPLLLFLIGTGALVAVVAVAATHATAGEAQPRAWKGARAHRLHQDERWLALGIAAQGGIVSVLGVTAALLGATLWTGHQQGLGIDVDGLAAVRYTLPSGAQPPEAVIGPALETAKSLDGVEGAAWSYAPPFVMITSMTVHVDGQLAGRTQ
jgi:hypothetical protein